MKTRTFQYKVILWVFIALFLLFLCGDFKIPDLSETALITTVGVSKNQNGGFDLTFIIAGTNENGGRESKLITTSAPTVAGGVEMLESGFGLTPKLAFLSLVIVEKEIADGEIFDVISFFLNTSGVHDSAKLLICDGDVIEILSADIKSEKDGLGGISKLLSSAETTPFAVPQINLKDFAEIYFSTGIDNCVPCIKLSQAGNQTLFDTGSGYLFSADKITAKVSGDTSLALNVLKGNGKDASFTITGAETTDGISDIRLSVADVSCKVEKTAVLGIPKVTASVKLKVGVLDQSNSAKTLAQVSGVGADKDAIATAVSEFLSQNIEELMRESFATNSDFLGIGESLILRQTKGFEIAPGYLKNSHLEIDVQVGVLQNHRL